MAHLDRHRAERVMAEAGLDALILLSPESFHYASGAAPGVATMWRRAGAVAVLVPADPRLPETAVVSDLFAKSFRRHSHIGDVRESPIWVETASVEGIDPALPPEAAMAAARERAGRSGSFSRPATFDPAICYRHLADALGERGLSGGRIGFEGSAVAVADAHHLEVLAGVDLVEASETVARLRMVKSAGEVGHLRRAAELAERGIAAVRDAIVVGVTRDQLAAVFAQAVRDSADDGAPDGAWEYISVGPDPWGGNAAARAGDLVKVDAGCVVEGYSSDTGRTFVLGRPSDLQARLFDALMAGFEAGTALLRPGVALAEVHRATQAAVRAAGFPGYTRGHFGHGLGTGPGSEAWPFISADSDAVIEPGMVMAFECPWYIDGVGGLIIENQILTTATGHEAMNALPTGLTRVGGA